VKGQNRVLVLLIASVGLLQTRNGDCRIDDRRPVNVSSKTDGHNRQDLSDFSRAFGRTANKSKVDSNYLTAIIQICTTVESPVIKILGYSKQPFEQIYKCHLTAIIQICTTVESPVSAVLEVLANFKSEVIQVVDIFNRV